MRKGKEGVAPPKGGTQKFGGRIIAISLGRKIKIKVPLCPSMKKKVKINASSPCSGEEAEGFPLKRGVSVQQEYSSADGGKEKKKGKNSAKKGKGKAMLPGKSLIEEKKNLREDSNAKGKTERLFCRRRGGGGL